MAPEQEVGLLLPVGIGWEAARGWVERAGQSGAARIWLGPAGWPPVALLAGLFRISPLRLGAVIQPSAHPVPLLAKHLTSLDVVAGGRLDVAVEDAEPPASPADAQAVPTAAEVLAAIRALASGERFSSRGAVAADGARCLPPAVRGARLPLWTARLVPPGAGAEGVPQGWARAGLGTVALTAWP